VTHADVEAALRHEGQYPRNETRTWCPGLGVTRVVADGHTWAPTTATPPPVEVNPEAPFDWGAAPQLSFTMWDSKRSPDSAFLSPVSPPGLIEGDAIFAQRFPGVVHAIILTDDEEEPSIAWAAHPGGSLTTAATLGGVTVVATTNRELVAYAEGHWIWQAQLEDLSLTPPVRMGNMAIVATLDGAVTAYDLASGYLRWRTSLGAEIRLPPLVSGDRVLVANQAGALSCLDKDGEVLWTVNAGRPRSMAVSGGPDPVVVYGKDGTVVIRAYSVEDGHQVWRSRIYEDPREMVALADALVVRDDDATLGVDWLTGAVMWRWSGQRTNNVIGGGQYALLLAEYDLVLLDAQGNEARVWPHRLLDATTGVTFLVAGDKTVLVFSGARLEIGVLP